MTAGGVSYDAAAAAAFFDDYGEREWARFERSSSPVSLAIHTHYLREFVRPGERVLDAGAGPGRFTIELARAGARVSVLDLSPEQLRLNAENLAGAGAEDAVEARVVGDVLDLSRWEDGAFDAVVCFGGPVSYALERAEAALDELLRVTRSGGRLLLSVMSRVGPFAHSLRTIVELAREHGVAANDGVVRTGMLPSHLSRGHLPMRLFRWSELEELFSRRPCRLLAASASELSPGVELELWPTLEPELREALVRWELELAAEPGALNAGAHLIAVVEKT